MEIGEATQLDVALVEIEAVVIKKALSLGQLVSVVCVVTEMQT
jgi:hypothetical protein